MPSTQAMQAMLKHNTYESHGNKFHKLTKSKLQRKSYKLLFFYYYFSCAKILQTSNGYFFTRN